VSPLTAYNGGALSPSTSKRNSGKLRHRVFVCDAVDTPTSFGDTTRTYTPGVMRSANMVPKKGRVWADGQQVDTGDTMVFEMRYDPELRAERFLRLDSTFGARLFRINRIADIDERHVWVDVYAEELKSL
jgi:hypothetical protein